MLSLSPSHPIPVFSPRFVRVSISLPSPHHPLLFSLFSSNNTSGRNNGLSDFGKGRGSTAAGIVPPFYQRNYFYALRSPTLFSTARISIFHRCPSSPIRSSPPPSRPYSISKITKQFLPGIRETSNPDGSRVFIPRNFLVYTDSCRASLSLSPSLPPSSSRVTRLSDARPTSNTRTGREILFRDISTTRRRAFDVTGDACRPFVKRSNALLAR